MKIEVTEWLAPNLYQSAVRDNENNASWFYTVINVWFSIRIAWQYVTILEYQCNTTGIEIDSGSTSSRQLELQLTNPHTFQMYGQFFSYISNDPGYHFKWYPESFQMYENFSHTFQMYGAGRFWGWGYCDRQIDYNFIIIVTTLNSIL